MRYLRNTPKSPLGTDFHGMNSACQRSIRIRAHFQVSHKMSATNVCHRTSATNASAMNAPLGAKVFPCLERITITRCTRPNCLTISRIRVTLAKSKLPIAARN
jgi:hypothetical protein